MIPILPVMVAALMAIQAGPAATVDALADRLIAAFPGAEEAAADPVTDPAELARLEAINPGRAGDILPVLERHAICDGAMRRAMMRRGVSRIVARMGEEKVNRLIGFYRSADLSRFSTLSTRVEQGEILSESEQAELDRITAAYPLREFGELMQSDLAAFMLEDVSFAELARCEAEKEAGLERLGIRTDEANALAVEPSSVTED